MKDEVRRTDGLERLPIIESRKRINRVVSIYYKMSNSAFIVIIRIALSIRLANVLFMIDNVRSLHVLTSAKISRSLSWIFSIPQVHSHYEIRGPGVSAWAGWCMI